MFKKYIVIFFLFIFTSTPRLSNAGVLDSLKGISWADRYTRSLSLDEKIGQLFMVAAYSNRDSNHTKSIANLIQNYKIGGLIFFQGGPLRQANLTNYYQSLSRVPLMIAIDGEWGLSMRLDSTVVFPRQMALGAIADNNLIYEFGLEIARECKRLGIHLNFAPVIDINNNPKNPVINDRSFGEDKYNVAGKGINYMLGMQDGGILANAKHFPGHGNTDKDSHKTLPLVSQSADEMDSVELYPFRELIKRGLASIMVAHLNVPALDSTQNQASTLSRKIVTDLLKNKMEFKGLVFTDALNMKGVSAYYPPGMVDVKALMAGNDVLLFSENVPIAIEQIKAAIAIGEISESDIDERVRRILFAKYLAGLDQYKPIDLNNLYEDLNSEYAKNLSRTLTEKSLTLLKTMDNLVYPKSKKALRIAAVSIGAPIDNEFLFSLNNYTEVHSYSIDMNSPIQMFDFLLSKVDTFDLVIVGLHGLSRYESKNFGFSKQAIYFMNKLDRLTNMVTVVFGNPYGLKNLDAIQGPIVVAYEENRNSLELSAQLLFGGIQAQGHLPVSASDRFKSYDGYGISLANRIKYTIPEDVGIDESKLSRVDEIARDAIAQGVMPGCQILAMKDGKVFYQKSFGSKSSSDPRKVQNSDIYDLASLTKILSTTLATMHLVDMGRLDLDKKISFYLPELKYTNKKNILVKNLLLHKAGLKPYIPFWVAAILNRSENLSSDSSSIFSIKVANKLFIRNDYPEKMWKEINSSELGPKNKYVYSDLDFYYLKEICERLYGKPIEEVLDLLFYQPLGLQTLGFNPWKRFPMERIIPTELDTKFRNQLVHGYVHDPGAAMLGGVAGHAGLFSDANDVGILMQMLLNGGEYEGKMYVKPETVNLFTKMYEPGFRRGLGFDKPGLKGDASPTCESASPSTFGHTGFTGTCVWADPESKFIFVFLSNRVNPDAENKKLAQMNIRTKIQEVFYQAFKIKNP